MSKWSVVFDCGGVLADDTFPAVYAALSTRYPEERRDHIIDTHSRNKESWTKLKTDPQFTENDYWTEIIANEGYKETPEELAELLRENLFHYEHTLSKIKELISLGVTVGICSNHGIAWFNAISKKFSFDEYFDEHLVVVSQAVSAAKPSPEIWAIVHERLQKHHGPSHKVNQVIFVDDKSTNVDAAKEFGFNGVTYDARKETGDHLMEKLLTITKFSGWYHNS